MKGETSPESSIGDVISIEMMKLELQPGDVLVIKMARHAEARCWLHESMRKLIPETVHIAFIDPDMEIFAIRLPKSCVDATSDISEEIVLDRIEEPSQDEIDGVKSYVGSVIRSLGC